MPNYIRRWRVVTSTPFVLLLLVAPLLAQGQPADETDASFVPDDAWFAALIRPRQMIQKYADKVDAPVELMRRSVRENMGVELDDLESMLFVIGYDEPAPPAEDSEEEEPRFDPEQFFSVVMRFREPINQEKFVQTDLFNHTEPAEHEGKKYHKSDSEHRPSLWFPDEQTLVFANDPRLKMLMKRGGMGMGSLRHHLERADPKADGLLVVSMETGKGWFKQVFEDEDIPLPLKPILDLPTHLDVAVITADLSSDEPAKLFALANDETSAKYLTAVAGTFQETLQAMLEDNREEIIENAPIEKLGKNFVTQADKFLTSLKFSADGRKIRGAVHAEGGMVAAAEMLVDTFAMQYHQSQMYSRMFRSSSISEALSESGLEDAVDDAAEGKGRYTAVAITDETGKPLLSWRVSILPQLGEEELYEQFHLDEPWDSEHNKKLLDKMPAIYAYDGEPGGSETRFLAVTGKGTFFSDPKGLKRMKLKDAEDATVIVVEVPKAMAVPWTKPAEFTAGETALKQLTGGDPYESHFVILTADGDSETLKKNKLTAEALKSFFSINGGEEIDIWQYRF